jgi:hypothetical protein
MSCLWTVCEQFVAQKPASNYHNLKSDGRSLVSHRSKTTWAKYERQIAQWEGNTLKVAKSVKGATCKNHLYILQTICRENNIAYQVARLD